MNSEQAKNYCLNKPEAWLDYPFGEGILVYKIKTKLFAIYGTEAGVGRLNLKCDPDEALALRDVFEAVIPGYHMNKRHWNTVILDGSIPSGEIERMIDNSYGLVFKSLPKKNRLSIEVKYSTEAIYG